MERILVSACLLGAKVRYDGRDALSAHPVLQRWAAQGRLVALCPEQLGGLPTPRPPAERTRSPQGALAVMTATGDDVTRLYLDGARRVASAAVESGIRIAILKDRSPSCGSTAIYDGSFSGRLIAGEGLTTAALREAGVRVFSDSEIDAAAGYVDELERR